MTPALPGIIAKVMTLVEHVLDYFVSIDYNQYGGNVCVLGEFNGTLTACGHQLANLWANALFSLSGLVGEIFAALGVNVT